MVEGEIDSISGFKYQKRKRLLIKLSLFIGKRKLVLELTVETQKRRE